MTIYGLDSPDDGISSSGSVELDLSRFNGRTPVELSGNTRFPPIGELPYLVTLSGYGFYWFNLELPSERALRPE